MIEPLIVDKSPQNTRVCIAMSGGVDSTAAACLLLEQGYNVFGLTMDLLQPPYAPSISSIKDAGTIAQILGIEHHYLDYKEIFADNVISNFVNTYTQGETPSPCILCNRFIKLGALANKARELGADIIVTGHYADIKQTTNGIELHQANDLTRDQSYFLFAVEKHNLQMLRCPLAHYNKEETRKIVQNTQLPIFQKPDSQDICFVPQGKYADLIKYYAPQSFHKGKITHIDGRTLGEHHGLIHYTIGQRRGLGIGGNEGILYVIKLDIENNQVIAGPQEYLKETKVLIRDVNWLGDKIPSQIDLEVKLRSRQKLVPATIKFIENNHAEVTLHSEFYGIAPGQGCCFYDGTRVMGGGFICKK